VKPGTIFSVSSIDTAAALNSSDAGMTVTVTVGSARGTSVREEVTFTASKNGAGSSEMRISPAGSPTSTVAGAKPAAVTTTRAGRLTSPGKAKRPSVAVCISLTAAPDTSSLTVASGTADPVASTTIPAIGVPGWASPAVRSSARMKACIRRDPSGVPYNSRTNRLRPHRVTRPHMDEVEGGQSP
jgi:hypothetical protein